MLLVHQLLRRVLFKLKLFISKKKKKEMKNPHESDILAKRGWPRPQT